MIEAKCKKCGISVDCQHTQCPLCKSSVDNSGQVGVLGYTSVPSKRVKHNLKVVTFRWLGIAVSIVVLLNAYQVVNSTVQFDIRVFWSSFVVLGYVLVARVCVPILCARRVFWQDSIKALVLSSLLLVLIDYQNTILTWSVAYVLPSVAMLFSVSCLLLSLYAKFLSTNTMFLSLIMVVFDIVLFVFVMIFRIVFADIHNESLTVLSASLCVAVFVLAYFILFRTDEYTQSTRAKLHF